MPISDSAINGSNSSSASLGFSPDGGGIGAGRLMLVSDTLAPVRPLEKEFDLLGNHVTIQGRIWVNSNGTLAGTALDMASAC